MSAAWPRLASHLLELVPTLPSWGDVEVFDGPPVTRDVPEAYFTVGFSLGEDVGGGYERTRNGAIGGITEESGTVISELVCTSGDVDMPTIRARAFALADELEDAVAADETLGVLGPGSTSALTVDVEPLQTTSGTAVRLTVSLAYLARPRP